jgi:excisionase family DNA binding protein
MTELLSASRAATVLGVSLRTLRKLIANRDLQVCRIGRRTLINPETLAQFVRDREASEARRESA